MSFDEEKLIILVSNYQEIYDLQNEHYMNSARKNNVWKEIAKELGVRDVVCKEKWKSLRDSYHRNFKKRQGKSGDGATKNKKWKYEHQMEFLQPYLHERITKSNIENTNSITSDDNEKSLPDLMATSPKSVLSPPSTSSETSLMFKNITARKKNQTQSTEKLTVAGALQNYLASRPATTPQTTMQSGDPIQPFFKAMADSVKTLLPDLQLKAKNKIYGIVSDLEYENLLKNSNTSREQAAAETKNNSHKQFLVPTPSTSGINKKLHKPTLSTSGINKQLLKPTPSTSCESKQFLQSTPSTSQFLKSQEIQVEEVQTASDSLQLFNNISDNESHITDINESQSILHTNVNTRKQYIITSDGFLIPQDMFVYESHEEE